MGKDIEDLNFLMNKTLYQEEKKILKVLPEEYPTLHIIGAPRSGTTLFMQVLSENLDIAYISNLIAAFWKAPLFGINLSNKLFDFKYKSSYKSDYGSTNEIQEPNEFHYFWNYHLKYFDFQQKSSSHEKKIDWDHFSDLLKNMCYTCRRPILFKSFLYGFHAQKAFEVLNKTCFIYIKRNVIDNAISILKLREDWKGDITKWVSIKPKQYDTLKEYDEYIQVVGQILFLEYEYSKQLVNLPEENKMFIHYKDLCTSPNAIIKQTKELLLNHAKGSIESYSCESLQCSSYKEKEHLDTVKKINAALDFWVSKHSELNQVLEEKI